MTPLRGIGLVGLFSLSMLSAAIAADNKTLLVAEPAHNIGYLPLYVGIRKGYFAKDGLDVQVMSLDSGSEHANAVLSGQAFAFIGGPEHDAFAKLKGGELRTIVNIVNAGNVYYLARSGKGPAPGQSMADYFKGKTIAVGQYGGTPNSITRYLLKQYKLDARADVTLNEMSTSAILAAVRSGNSIIGVTQEPLITQGKRAGIWGEPFINIPKMLGPYAYSTINVSLASIKKDPDTIRKFVKDLIQSLKYTYDNPDGAAEVAKQEFPTMPIADLKATLDRSFADKIWSADGTVSRESWKTAESVVLDAGILTKAVPYDDIIDMQFVHPDKASSQ